MNDMPDDLSRYSPVVPSPKSSPSKSQKSSASAASSRSELMSSPPPLRGWAPFRPAHRRARRRLEFTGESLASQRRTAPDITLVDSMRGLTIIGGGTSRHMPIGVRPTPPRLATPERPSAPATMTERPSAPVPSIIRMPEHLRGIIERRIREVFEYDVFSKRR